MTLSALNAASSSTISQDDDAAVRIAQLQKQRELVRREIALQDDVVNRTEIRSDLRQERELRLESLERQLRHFEQQQLAPHPHKPEPIFAPDEPYEIGHRQLVDSGKNTLLVKQDPPSSEDTSRTGTWLDAVV